MNKFIIFFFACMTLISAGLFVADLQGYFNKTQQPVAILRNSGGIVRRLAKDQLTWDRAQIGTLFGAGDTISTGEDASARLTFYAGGELELDAGGMVVLGDDLKELKLSFVSGSGKMRVAKTAKKKFSVGKLTGTAAKQEKPRIEISEVDELSVKLPRPAPLVSAIQEKNIRNPNRSLSTEGELVSAIKLPPSPEIISPPNDAVIDLSDEKSPKLEWKVKSELDQNPSGYEIVLRPAEGKGESKILNSSNTNISLSTLDRFSTGKYLWSVRSIYRGGAKSPASSTRWLEVRIPAQIEKPILFPVKIE